MPVPLTSNAQHNAQQQQQQHQSRGAPVKTVKHRSSKPIINWLQRKLGGTARARRASELSASRSTVAHGRLSGVDSTYNGRAASLKPLHGTAVSGRAPVHRDVDENGHMRGYVFRPMSNEISLNSTDDISDDGEDDESNRRSSGAAVSMWGSRSNPVEADEDASLRPLPPTSPPSPSPSRSSSSYMSNPRTFKSMSTSTKPTTLLSIDLAPMAHIAQAPPTPTSVSAYNTPGPSPISRFPPHVRTVSSGPGGAVTFSALPPSTPPSSRPSSLDPAGRASVSALQAPAHTSHHPRNNPRPSSPPLDNASVLTLASSAFATPFADRGRSAAHTPYQYSWTAGADSVSHLSHMGGGGDSLSHMMLDGELAADEQNASVRALRPRSSRRDSWESEVSRWSAGASVLNALGPAGRERSVRTAPSFRTGGQGTVDLDDMASVSLVDEDVVLTREEGTDELDDGQEGMHDEDERSREFSPLSALSIEEASESTEIQVDTQSVKDVHELHDLEDVATPGPTTRVLVLPSSFEMMSLPSPAIGGVKRPMTPPSCGPSKDTETTLKKGKRIAGLKGAANGLP
ncbi:hypothetical protein EW145_g2290 [Phellinidium pouzarii]|uniref:Uncharacterized protein n=1 Tax=Phellinidium pouzarii TaxID=167371 RepID=A0A4S4LBI5_9AGAM|nr:hypothetical protein EW145_g2290 [Phellinidium pouzarii]